MAQEATEVVDSTVPDKFKTDPKAFFENLASQFMIEDEENVEEVAFRQAPGFNMKVVNKKGKPINTGKVAAGLADPVVTWEIWQAAMTERKKQMGSDLEVDPTMLVPQAISTFKKSMEMIRDGRDAAPMFSEASNYMMASVDHMMEYLGLHLPPDAKADFLRRIAEHWDQQAGLMSTLGAKKDAVYATQGTASMIATMARQYEERAQMERDRAELQARKKFAKRARPGANAAARAASASDVESFQMRFQQVSDAPATPVDDAVLEEQARLVAALKEKKNPSKFDKEREDFVRQAAAAASVGGGDDSNPAGLPLAFFMQDGPFTPTAEQLEAAGVISKDEEEEQEDKPSTTTKESKTSAAPAMIEGVPIGDSDLAPPRRPAGKTHTVEELLAKKLAAENAAKHLPVAEELFGEDISHPESQIVTAFIQRHTAGVSTKGRKKKGKKAGSMAGEQVEVVKIGMTTEDEAEEAATVVSTSNKSNPSFRQNKLTIVNLPNKKQLDERKKRRDAKAKSGSAQAKEGKSFHKGQQQPKEDDHDEEEEEGGIMDKAKRMFSSFLQMGQFEVNEAGNRDSIKAQSEKILNYLQEAEESGRI